MAEITAIRAGDLVKEQSPIRGSGSQSPWRDSVADELTPARLASLMRAADHGDPHAYLVLAEEMGEREPHYASVLGTRSLGVSGSDRSVSAASDDPDDVAIADDIEQLVQTPEFEGLIVDLMDGVAKGFAASEVIWDRSLNRYEPVEYRFREQRYFTFDQETYRRPLLLTDDEREGEELKPFKWIVHAPKIRAGVPMRSGLARTIAICYSAKRYTIANWMSFLDVYGIPLKVGKYPNSMRDRVDELFQKLKRLGADATAVLPEEMKVEIVESKSTGTVGIFRETAEYWDKQTSKVVLGQTMTTDDGASLSQSKTHERVRFDIRAADARAIVATINRHLIRPFVDLNYGPRDLYPSLVIHTKEPEDTATLMSSVKSFVSLVGKVQESEIRDRLGIAEPEEGADLLKPEAVVNAAAAPKPEPNPDVEGGTPDEDADDDQPDGADPDAEVEGEGGKGAELNRTRTNGGEGFKRKPKIADTVDDLVDAKLTQWEPLLEGNVGRLLAAIGKAKSYDEALELLAELAADEGDVVDIEAVTRGLARATFASRGVGDATDDTEL